MIHTMPLPQGESLIKQICASTGKFLILSFAFIIPKKHFEKQRKETYSKWSHWTKEQRGPMISQVSLFFECGMIISSMSLNLDLPNTSTGVTLN